MRRWEDLTSADLSRIDPQHTVALLPVAAVEQHGPHLPLGTDAFIVDALVDAAAALLPPGEAPLLLPPQRIGHSPEHACFPGTLTLPPSTLLELWLAIGAGAAAAGIRKLLILNSHGGQGGLVDVAAVNLRARHAMTVVRFSYYRIVPPPGLVPAEEARFGLHGGLLETALLLHVAPHLVRLEAAVDFPSRARAWEARLPALPVEAEIGLGWCARDLNPEGAVGNAAAATAELGRALLVHWAERLAGAIVALRDCPPFPAPAVGAAAAVDGDQDSASSSAGSSQ